MTSPVRFEPVQDISPSPSTRCTNTPIIEEIDEAFATRIPIESQLGSDDVDTNTLAETQPSVTRVAPTLLVTLQLDYDNKDGSFFNNEAPDVLEGLLPNYIYVNRINSLNASLSRLRVVRDYMPLVRTGLLGFLILFFIVMLQMGGAISGGPLGPFFTVSLVVLCLVAWTYYKSFAYDRLIEPILLDFNKQDESIQLKWSRTQKSYTPPLVSVRWTRKAAEVPRRIQIEYIPRPECLRDIEFLPAYSAESCVLTMIDGLDRRCPTYKTML
ncbi:hypothetical protein BDR26DRAFT_858304 [Obelidium mucronatum]|nr:hypothetical protein BDR26DRAFT_858304 [Obelidium mucronatum]